MSTPNNGGPAFPVTGFEGVYRGHPANKKYSIKPVDPAPGMSLRDYFAAKALVAALSHEKNMICLAIGNTDPCVGFPAIANDCYKIADAMLKARSS